LECALPNPEAAALIVDESGTIVFASEPVQRLLGHAPQALCGQSVEVLLPERISLAHIAQRLRFTDHRRSRPMGTGLPLLALSHCGAEIPVDISLSPVQRGLLTFTVVILQPRELAARAHARAAGA
jgi:PAS domain S-box-containing protein